MFGRATDQYGNPYGAGWGGGLSGMYNPYQGVTPGAQTLLQTPYGNLTAPLYGVGTQQPVNPFLGF
jgi:hypothetical protein